MILSFAGFFSGYVKGLNFLLDSNRPSILQRCYQEPKRKTFQFDPASEMLLPWEALLQIGGFPTLADATLSRSKDP